MASAAREYRYAHREFSTNGSLARDLDWAVRERELEHAGEVPRHERTQAAPKVYHKEQVLVRERQAIPVLSVLGVTAVAVAAVMLLLSYVQLTTLAADTVALKSELTVLQAENVSLTAQHEQMFDMATVKEVAAGRRNVQAHQQPDHLSGSGQRGQRRGLPDGDPQRFQPDLKLLASWSLRRGGIFRLNLK